MDYDHTHPEGMNIDYTHPEQHNKGLIFAPNHEMSEEVRAQRKKMLHSDRTRRELCGACGWSTYNQLCSSYDPRIKIFYTRDNIGLWAIGTKWFIRDQPNDGSLGNDYMTQEFLRGQQGLDIPLIEEMRRLSKPTDAIHHTLMSRAQGLRQFTAPTAQKVDGSRLDDNMIAGHCSRRHPPTCKQIGYTTSEWFDNIADELRGGLSSIHNTKDPQVIEEKLQELKDNFPKGEPYVLTHGDLNLANIIVDAEENKIEAIIDWEMAGYYPWWAERWLSIVWGDGISGPLFRAVWKDVCPEMDAKSFEEQVIDKVNPVVRAWQACKVEHSDEATQWLRPPFCECQPYGGSFDWISLGNGTGHKISNIDEETKDPRNSAGKGEAEAPRIVDDGSLDLFA
ncbi:hypothetical protein LCER1_G009343 [Lachnellula cervina]|uniref:Aminoglycoside phosphotransferase domain-containing protein n=1 Tax=Lachnellula cervina TaxID=1316786 RepID=A0A7D8UI53_9HELO|nr:hypothetical protein LCER1_G009343 [Lachnellula cervina]